MMMMIMMLMLMMDYDETYGSGSDAASTPGIIIVMKVLGRFAGSVCDVSGRTKPSGAHAELGRSGGARNNKPTSSTSGEDSCLEQVAPIQG